MQLYNLKHPDQVVSFKEASIKGLGKDRGLFFPTHIPQLDQIDELLQLDFLTRCERVVSAWIGDEFEPVIIRQMVERAFVFDAPLVKVKDGLHSLELFHGPTLAFKDFGARFMAQVLSRIASENIADGTPDDPNKSTNKMTILTATSGDTGAAVADAFYQIDNIDVVVLYPDGKISEAQKRLFTTLGDNISAVAIKSDFDACQRLVKLAFEDADINDELGLNSANSINISRLLAQICYYFEAVAQFVQQQGPGFVLTNETAPVISVPSGNFGNLTAGLFAKAMGLPIKHFIAATNSNDTVPRYLNGQNWQVNPTVATMSNAMDVSDPSNWPRVEAIFEKMGWSLDQLKGISINEAQTQAALLALREHGYMAEPHAAVAFDAIRQLVGDSENAIFLATAHPAKFKEVVESVLKTPVKMPEKLRLAMELESHFEHCEDDFPALKSLLLKH